MEIIIGTLGLLFGLLVGGFIGWRAKAVGKESKHVSCHMCSRPSAGGLILWQIRGRSMKVCDRCHHYYKLRFEKEIKDDTHSFQKQNKENS